VFLTKMQYLGAIQGPTENSVPLLLHSPLILSPQTKGSRISAKSTSSTEVFDTEMPSQCKFIWIN